MKCVISKKTNKVIQQFLHQDLALYVFAPYHCKVPSMQALVLRCPEGRAIPFFAGERTGISITTMPTIITLF